MKLNKNILRVALGLLLATPQVYALPDGTRMVPGDVKIPTLNGKTLPVSLYASTRDKKEIYVKPLEGMFVGEPKSLDSITNDCGNIQNLVEQSRILVQSERLLTEDIKNQTAEYIALEAKLKPFIEEREKLSKLEATYSQQLTSLKAQRTGPKTDYDNAVAKVTDLKNEFSLSCTNKATPQCEKLQNQIDEAINEARAAQNVVRKIDGDIRKVQAALVETQNQLADAVGKVDGVKKSLSETAAMIGDLEARLDQRTKKVSDKLEVASRSMGGMLRMSANFAPAEYINALSEANPGYIFHYVPVVSAIADITFPKAVENALVTNPKGALILNQKFMRASETYGSDTFFSKVFAKYDSAEMPLEAIARMGQQYSDDLEGLKDLVLNLTEVGACSLKRPEIFLSEFERAYSSPAPDKAHVFSLALFYSYPVHYDVQVEGTYNRTKILYELFKRSSSSSWFGFKKKQKEEFIRRVTDKEYIDIKVTSTSPQFSQQDAEALREKMSAQIAFEAVKEYLDLSKGVPPNQVANANLNEPRTPSVIGQRLMTIPNPWAFWGGLVLTSLDGMFGSSSAESINNQIATAYKHIKWTEGFTMAHSGSIALGDLNADSFKSEK